jgi:large repetitive protein
MRHLLDLLCRKPSPRGRSNSRSSSHGIDYRPLRAEPLEQRTLLSASTGADPSEEGQLTALAAEAVNTAPTLWIRGMRTIANGAELSIPDVGVFSDPDTGHSSFTGTINWGDGTAPDTVTAQIDIAGAEGELTWGTFDGAHTFTAVGRYEASFQVADDQGGQSILRYMTIDVTESVPQDLVLDPVAAINEGQSAVVRGTFEDTGSGKSHTVTTSWGDGSPDTETVLPSGTRSFVLNHPYSDDGPNPGGTNPPSQVYTYPISVTVTDNDSNSIGSQTSVIVNNVAPNLTVIGSQQYQEGWTFDGVLGNYSDVGVLDTHTATINWGDGTSGAGTIDTTAGTISGTHSYPDENRDESNNEIPYTVTVTLTDDDTGTTAETISMLITNVAPVMEAIPGQNSDEGQLISFGPTSFTDPGVLDTHTATVDWGDGNTTSATVDANGKTVSGSHTFADNGTYTVAVTLADNGGAQHVQAFQVVVANVPPTLTVASDRATNSGTTLEIVNIGVFSDPGFDNPNATPPTVESFTYQINWGDGTTIDTGAASIDVPGSAGVLTQGSLDGSHLYTMPGEYTVTVTVIDDDGGQDSGNLTVTVSEVAPVLTVNVPDDLNLDEGETFSWPNLATFTHANSGTARQYNYSINWGNGHSSSGQVTDITNNNGVAEGRFGGSHTYADNGTFTVTVRVEVDGTSAFDQESFSVVVANVNPSLSGLTNQTVLVGSTLNIDPLALVSDPGYDNPLGSPATVETFTYRVEWGDGAVDNGNVTVNVVGGPGVDTQGSFGGSHAYTASGQRTATVTVTDDDGGQDTGTFLVNVNEVAPVLSIDVPDDLDYDEGETFTWADLASFTHTSSNSSQAYSYSIDWGDGKSSTGQVTNVTSNQGQNQGSFGGSHTYADNGTYTVNVRLDVDGTTASDQGSFSVIVKNISPSLTGVKNYSATVDTQLNIDTIRVTDPGFDNPSATPQTVETFIYRVNWGDGTEADTGDVTIDVTGSPGVLTQGSFGGTHTYQTASTGEGYVGTVTVTDDDGGAIATNFVVKVSAAAPAASAALIGPLTETEFLVRSPSVLLAASSRATAEPTTAGPLTETEFRTQSLSFQAPMAAAAATENAPPILGTVGNRTLDEGQLDIVSIGAFLDFDSQGPFPYSIDWGDGGTPETGTATITSSGTPTAGTFNGSRLMDDDLYTVAFSLSDEQGNSVTESVYFTIENVPPTADPGGPYEVEENGAVQLQGEGYDPAEHLDPLTFEWDLDDDGIYGESGADAERGDENLQNPVFSATGLSGPQSWPVRLRVRDDDGGVSPIETTSVQVLNVAPTIQNLQIVTPVDEGNTSTVSGNLIDPSEGDTLTLEIDWGDGSPVDTYSGLAPGTSFGYDHVYQDDGLTPGGSPSHEYSVSVAVADDAGGSNSYPLTVRVDNISPLSVTLEDLDRANEHDEVTLRGSFGEPGVLDTHVVTINWGDGNEQTVDLTQGELQFTATHRYLDDGPTPGGTVPPSATFNYQIEVTVEDDDTGTGTSATTVTVDNVAPTLRDLATIAVNENDITTVSGEIYDPGTLDTFVLQVNWNDQTAVQSIPLGTDPIDAEGITWNPETRQFAINHQYLDDGLTPGGSPFFDYGVNLTVTDDDTGTSGSTETVRVSNVDPTVAIAGIPTEPPLEGDPISLSASYSDPGTLDTFTYAWSVTRGGLPYDDGSGNRTDQPNFTFTPDDDGTYRVTLRVTDDDTGSSTASVDIAVENAPPVAEDDHYQFDGIGVFEVEAPGILGNDYDPGRDYPLRAVEFSELICTGSGADCGTLIANEDGSFTYEPVEDFSGTVGFTYRALDQDGAVSISPATVTIDVGMNSTISGYVYAVNQDERFDPDRLPLPGVFVTLEATDDVGVVIVNALTDDDGYYEFTSLRAGTYQITERQPAAVLDGGQHEQTATIRVNEDSTNNNFAESWLRPQQISIGMFLASNLDPPPDDYFWPHDLRERMAQAEEQAGNDYEAAVIRYGDMIDAARRGSVLSITGTELSERFIIEPNARPQKVTVWWNGFERVYEAAVDEVFTLTIHGGGGSDEAELYDSEKSDLLEGRYNLARMTNDRFLIDLYDFDRIRAISRSGGNDRTSIATTVDYLLTLEGPWDDVP